MGDRWRRRISATGTGCRVAWRSSAYLTVPGPGDLARLPGQCERLWAWARSRVRAGTGADGPGLLDEAFSKATDPADGKPVLAKLAGMAYDTELADRIRFLIGTGPGVTEKKMFGGLAFLIGGNMAISASGRGGALVRVDPAETGALVATANATVAVMGGRAMRGWLRVSSEDLQTDEQLTEWVNRAVGYARSLPPKR